MASSRRKDDGKRLPPLSSAFKHSTSNPVSPARSSTVSPVGLEADSERYLKDKKFKYRKHSRWYYLRRRLTKKGVVCVNKNHPRYELLSCIREGISQLATDNPGIRPKQILLPADFSDIISTSISFEGKEFVFESFASSAFATIRQAIGIQEEDFLYSIAPNNLPYLEFISNSKSGQDFFLSNDMQYMFKSNRKRDVNFLLSMLGDYLQHFITYPHSLLVKYIGCYAIKIKGKAKRYFLVMRSVFFPADRIEDRFDIKGCTAGRYQKPNRPDSHVITVLKDQNFFNEELDFGDQGEWFISQIQADSNFLKNFNCIDYSLLIGRQIRTQSERNTQPVSKLIDRIGMSISPLKTVEQSRQRWNSGEEDLDADPRNDGNSESGGNRSPCEAWVNNNNDNNNPTNGSAFYFSSTSPEARSELSATHDLPGSVNGEVVSSSVILPQVKPGIMFPRSLIDGVDNFQAEHRRLLPKGENSLHIIDGLEHRYFLGIVDFLTRFDWRLKFAQYWKMVKYGCGDHSTKNPEVYNRRFVKFLRNRVR